MGELPSETDSAAYSIHTATVAEVHRVPMNAIIRPIPPVVDEDKVNSLMETIKVFVSKTNVPGFSKLLVVNLLLVNIP